MYTISEPAVTGRLSRVRPLTWSLASAAATFITMGFGLLLGGSITGSVVLLAWGLSANTIAVGFGCLASVRAMMDEAVRQCVTETTHAVRGHMQGAITDTAMQVGTAIAGALTEDAEDDDEPWGPRGPNGPPLPRGTTRIYS